MGFVFFALVSAYVEIKPFRNTAEIFIGYADEAALADCARSIAEGRGAVVHAVWLLHNGGVPGSAVTHPEDYRSIYTAYIVAVFFKLFGATRAVLLLSAVVFKTGIAALAAYWAYRLTHSYLAAFVCSLFLLIDPAMASVVNGYFDVYLTFFILLAGTVLVFAVSRESSLLFLLAGCLVGICIGIKPSGGLPLGCLLVFLALHPNRLRLLARCWPFPVGVALLLAPLAAHNLSSFGILIAPAHNLAHSAGNVWYAGADYRTSMFNPEPYVLSEEQKRELLLRIPLRHLKEFLAGALDGQVLPVWMFPFIWYGLALFLSQWYRERSTRQTPEGLYVLYACLLLVGGLVLSLFVVYYPRYWNFLVPLFAVLAIQGMACLPRPLLVFAGLWTVVMGATYHKGKFQQFPVPREYQVVKQLVPEDAVILTARPCEIAFHTRRPCVMLPFTDKEETLKQVARRYGAGFIVLGEEDPYHEVYDRLREGKFPDFIKPLYRSDTLVIGILDLPPEPPTPDAAGSGEGPE